MPKFSLFRKKKEPEQKTIATAPSEEPKQEQQEPTAPAQEIAQGSITQPVEQKPEVVEVPSKTYLKAMPLRELADVEKVKNEVTNGNIIILRVAPLASKSIEDVKTAVNDLYQFAESTGGDIARLGEERVVICPKNIRIWREKTPTPVSNEPVPTAA
ncbi:MAG: cell division protein SepF [Candidatus Bathyarchaeota archaeon]|nr:cell division protein SepF [Candidatus Bathyarchaeota archaeon]